MPFGIVFPKHAQILATTFAGPIGSSSLSSLPQGTSSSLASLSSSTIIRQGTSPIVIAQRRRQRVGSTPRGPYIQLLWLSSVLELRPAIEWPSLSDSDESSLSAAVFRAVSYTHSRRVAGGGAALLRSWGQSSLSRLASRCRRRTHRPPALAPQLYASSRASCYLPARALGFPCGHRTDFVPCQPEPYLDLGSFLTMSHSFSLFSKPAREPYLLNISLRFACHLESSDS